MKTAIVCTRRDFIKATGAGVAACAALDAWAPASHGSKTTPWRVRQAVSSIMYETLPLSEVCRLVSGAGFEALDIWGHFDKCRHLQDAAELGADGVKELLTKNNLKLSAFTIYFAEYEKYAELLGKCGGGIAVRASIYGKFKPDQVTSSMKGLLEKLKPLAELAEKHNSYLAIENHGDALLSTPDSFKTFVDLNKSPRIGIALAPYHLQSINASVPDVIRICGKQLLFFYAWQKADGLNQLPGHGPADFKPWIEALKEIGYERYVNPFMHGHPETDKMVSALEKSRDYLKKLAE